MDAVLLFSRTWPNREGLLEHPSSFDPFIDQVLPFQAIRITKSRMSHSRIVLFDRFSRQSNTSAALLNIGMFNTIQDDSELRGAAYKLLQAVCTSLSYSGDLFLPSTGTLVPHECAEVFTNLFTRRVYLWSPRYIRRKPEREIVNICTTSNTWFHHANMSGTG